MYATFMTAHDYSCVNDGSRDVTRSDPVMVFIWLFYLAATSTRASIVSTIYSAFNVIFESMAHNTPNKQTNQANKNGLHPLWKYSNIFVLYMLVKTK